MIPQLLAPAGNFAIAEMAFDHGADAVYIGVGQLNLRAHSPNFAVQDLSELLDTASKRNKKVYIALNIMPDDYRMDLVEQTLLSISRLDSFPDAFIISDPGVLQLCNQIIPSVPLHLSTQTGAFNSRALQFWKKQGVKRVVLPRELSLEQIKLINKQNAIETEIFIHGAMCVSVSGRCLLGAYINGRHPNLGDCPQPCRFRYRIIPVESSIKTENCSFDAEETENGVYLLNSKDLCTISILPEIIDSGVHSLKIEGRNKSIHYVASVVKTYREAIDKYLENPQKYKIESKWLGQLDSVEHRPYTTGFYKDEIMLQEVFSSKATVNARIMGTVKGILNGVPVIDVKNSFGITDILEVIPVQKAVSPFNVTFQKFTDLSGNQLFRIPSNRLILGHGGTEKLHPGDMLRMPQIKS